MHFTKLSAIIAYAALTAAGVLGGEETGSQDIAPHSGPSDRDAAVKNAHQVAAGCRNKFGNPANNRSVKRNDNNNWPQGGGNNKQAAGDDDIMWGTYYPAGAGQQAPSASDPVPAGAPASPPTAWNGNGNSNWDANGNWNGSGNWDGNRNWNSMGPGDSQKGWYGAPSAHPLTSDCQTAVESAHTVASSYHQSEWIAPKPTHAPAPAPVAKPEGENKSVGTVAVGKPTSSPKIVQMNGAANGSGVGAAKMLGAGALVLAVAAGML